MNCSISKTIGWFKLHNFRRGKMNMKKVFSYVLALVAVCMSHMLVKLRAKLIKENKIEG